jgi:hypothetical protein
MNSTITPTPPMMNAGYPNNLFRAISDTPPSPAGMIRSIDISSYIPILLTQKSACEPIGSTDTNGAGSVSLDLNSGS